MPITRSSAPIIRSGFPRAGSLSGDQKYQEFRSAVLDICGDTRILWLPSGFTMPTTSADRYARALTNTGTFTLSTQGSGASVAFDGSTNHVTAPDSADLSFGDGTYDQPFSIAAWVNQTGTATIKTIYARYDLTTGATAREIWFYLDAAEKLVLECYDESAAKKIGRTYNTALGTGSVLFLVGTYDGSRAASGIKLYSADAQIDDTDSSAATYVAMENTAALSYIGASEGADGLGANWFNGSILCLIKAARVLDLDDQATLKTLGNAYFGLTL